MFGSVRGPTGLGPGQGRGRRCVCDRRRGTPDGPPRVEVGKRTGEEGSLRQREGRVSSERIRKVKAVVEKVLRKDLVPRVGVD